MPTTTARENYAGTDTYVGFIQRGIRSFARKAEAGQLDVDALAQIAAIRAHLADTEAQVVAALRADGFSWSQIGAETGLSRSQAMRKWGHLDGDTARKPGGQPGHLR